MNKHFMNSNLSTSIGSKRTIFFLFSFFLFLELSAQISQPSIEIQPNKNYGFEPFKPKSTNFSEIYPIQENKIEFIEYRLIVRDQTNHAREDLFNWPKETKESKVYRLNQPEGGKAVINVAFWGVSPKSGTSSTLVLPTQQKNYKISQLFADAISLSASTLIKTDNSHELTLLIVPIPRGSELNMYFKEEINAVHSEFIYILWDKQAIASKPDFNGIVYQSEEFKLPLPKSSTGLILLQLANKTKINYSLQAHQQTISKGIISADNPLNYDAYKTERIVLEKPKGFNLINKGEPDSADYLNPNLVIDAVVGKTDIIQLVPVAFYNVYIDASQIKSKSKTSQILDSITSLPGGFMVFLSNKSQPIVAQNKTDLESLQSELYNITFQAPKVTEDLKSISSRVNFETISRRVGINYYLILSNDIYKSDFMNIKNNLQEQCRCKNAKFTVYLNIPPDELNDNDRFEGVNYIFQN